MGSGTLELTELAEASGRAVAESGHHLLTGAGGGVMLAAARAYVAHPMRKGLSLGIVRARSLPELAGSSRRWTARGTVNPYIELPIRTHLPESGRNGKDLLSRNHINVLTADVVVVLPGGNGTRSELELSIEYGRPTVLFIGEHTVGGSSADELRTTFGDSLQLAESEVQLSDRIRSAIASSKH